MSLPRAAWLLAALALACATAEEVDEDGFGGAAGGGGDGASGALGGAAGGGGAGGRAHGGGGGVQGGAGGSVTTGGGGAGGGSGGSGASGGVGGGTGTGGTGGTGTSCTGTSACSGAADLGTVSGDSGSDTAQSKGSGSKFFKLRVTEDNNSVIGQELTLKVTLTVPSTADYDVYAYLNTTSDVMPCGGSPAKTSQSGGIGANEQLKLNWGEGTIANGGDDGRWVVIEIRHKAGPCDAGTQWQLIVAGNV
jgi:hypothetical protein